MRVFAPLAALTALAAMPVLAVDTVASPDSISQTFLADMKAQKSGDMVMHFFGDSELVARKASSFAELARQLDHTFEIYGPVVACELTDTVKRGTLVETRLYLCQHKEMVLRWRLTMMKTAKGWNGQNLRYDEKIWQGIDQD